MNIALTGKLRSGKDTIAEYLVSHYGYTRFAFGDGIRRVTRELYPEAYVNGEKPRALLQGFGQMARAFDENVWVNDCFRMIDEHRLSFSDPANVSVVISDLRQPNELSRCRSEGYVIIRVNAPDTLRLDRATASGDSFNAETLTHETEQHVDTFAADYDAHNDGTVDELYAQIDAILAKIGVERVSG